MRFWAGGRMTIRLDILTDYGLVWHGVWRTWLFWPLGVPSYASVSPPPLLHAFTTEASSTVSSKATSV